MQGNCKHCGEIFKFPSCRKDSAKFCGRKCADAHPKTKKLHVCPECGGGFERGKGKSQLNKFCSTTCTSSWRKRVCVGNLNPNWKGRNINEDGYVVKAPSAGKGRLLHHHVVMENLWLSEIPDGAHVHHRNCNRLDNRPENLQLMLASDHKWLHHQFGIAVLSAIESGGISIDDVVKFSDDPIRAKWLLLSPLPVQSQLRLLWLSGNPGADIRQMLAVKPAHVELCVVGSTN